MGGRRTVALGLVMVVGLACLAPTASGGTPTRERIEIDEMFVDATTCSFAISVHSVGHAIMREYDRAKGVVSLTTLNIKSVAAANGKSVRVHDVGSDQIRIAPDGTVILSIRGQIPFGPSGSDPGFNGVIKINMETGEVLHEPSAVKDRAGALCAALAP